MGDESPSPLLQVGDGAVSDRRVNHDAGDTCLCARRVLQNQVLDVYACLTELAEKPTESARLIGDEHLYLAVSRRSSTVLAGNPRNTLVTRSHQPIDRTHGTATQGTKFSGRFQVREQVIEVGL